MIPVARTLYDITQGFDSPIDAPLRLRRALRLLRGIMPADRCALLEARAGAAARFVVEPDVPEEREPLRRVLTRCLAAVTDGPPPAADWLPPDVAHLVPCGSTWRCLSSRWTGCRACSSSATRDRRLHGRPSATPVDRRQPDRRVSHRVPASRAGSADRERARGGPGGGRVGELRQGRVPGDAGPRTAESPRADRDRDQTIRGVAELDPDVQEAREVVERQVKHLVRLVDDLLDVSRITRGKIQLARRRSRSRRSSPRRSRPRERHRRPAPMSSSVSLPTTRSALDADPARITQVVANLLENAAKYTDREAGRSGTGYREGDEVVLRVRDNGIGIAPRCSAESSTCSSRPSAAGPRAGRARHRAHAGPPADRAAWWQVSARAGAGPRQRVRRSRARRRAGWARGARRWLIGRGTGSPHPHRRGRRQRPEGATQDPAARRPPCGGGWRWPSGRGARARDRAGRRFHRHRAAPSRRLRGRPPHPGRAREAQDASVALTGYGQEQDHRRSSEAGFDAHLVKPVSYDDLTRILRPPGPSA